MKVLICGCPRSGTTLMSVMLGYFENTHVIKEERSPLSFIKGARRYKLCKSIEKNGKIFVIKKPNRMIGAKSYYSIKEAVKGGFKIIFMIRDGRDVIVSKHKKKNSNKVEYYVRPEMWIEINRNNLLNTKTEGICYIKYEELVSNPTKIMNVLSSFLGVGYNPKFSEFYEFEKFDKSIASVMNGIRPITASQIGNWNKKEHLNRMLNLCNSSHLQEFCQTLIKMGYEKDSEWVNKIRRYNV